MGCDVNQDTDGIEPDFRYGSLFTFDNVTNYTSHVSKGMGAKSALMKAFPTRSVLPGSTPRAPISHPPS